MTALWRVFRYELRNQGRRPGYLFTSIGLPILAIAAFFVIQALQKAGQSTPSQIFQASQTQSDSGGVGTKGSGLFTASALPVGLIDLSGLIGSDAPLANFRRLPDGDTANAALRNNQISGYVLIPADYLKTGTVELWTANFGSVFGSLTTAELNPLLKSALADHIQGLDTHTISRLTEQTPDVTNHR